MDANVAELVAAEFGIEVAGGPERFKKSGWFSVGLTKAECPICRSRMQGYRMPYHPKPRTTYHYWALACLECKRLIEPAHLDEISRKMLYNNSLNGPKPTQAVGVTHPKLTTGVYSGSRQNGLGNRNMARGSECNLTSEEINKLRQVLEGRAKNGVSHEAETQAEKNLNQEEKWRSPISKPDEKERDGGTPITTGKGSASPSRQLAEKIVLRLVRERLLTERLGRELLPKLAEGRMLPDDWRLPIELSDPEEDPE